MAFAGPGPLAAAPSYPWLAGTVTNLVSENSIKWNWDPSSELPGPLESDLLVEKKEFVSRVCASFAMGLEGETEMTQPPALLHCGLGNTVLLLFTILPRRLRQESLLSMGIPGQQHLKRRICVSTNTP